MNWLTQLTLDHAALARRHLRDSYDWHQRVWQCFPGRDGQTRDLLTRLDCQADSFRLLIVSCSPTTQPDRCPPDAWGTQAMPEEYFDRTRYAFELRANPTKSPGPVESPVCYEPTASWPRTRTLAGWRFTGLTTCGPGSHAERNKAVTWSKVRPFGRS